MASIRKAKRRADKSKDRKINLPASKIGQAGRVMSDKEQPERPRYEVVLYEPKEIQTREPRETRQQPEPKAVVERQLGKLAGREIVNKTSSSLEDARQRSAEWMTSESSKFKSNGITVLFPEDLNNIRKIVKEEIKLAGGVGGGGIGLPIPGMGGKGGTVPTPGGGDAEKVGKGSKLLKLAKVGGVLGVIGAAVSVLEAIGDNKETEREYREGKISKEERDQKEKEVNYRTGGEVIGSALGGAAGALLGPAGAILGSMAGGFVGRHVGGAFGSSPIQKAAQSMESNTSVQKADIVEAQKAQQKSSSDAVNAITKASEKFSISKDEMLAVAMQESSMNPKAHAKKSNAVGLFQFLPTTWNGLIKNNEDIAKQYGIGSASTGGDDDRTDPFKSAVMYALLRQETMKSLGKISTGDGSVDAYIMHLLGGPVGKKVIAAYINEPSSKISAHVSQNQYTANRELMEKSGSPVTVSEFVANIKVKLSTKLEDAKKHVEKFEMPSDAQPQKAPQESAPVAPVAPENTEKKPLEQVANIKDGVDVSGLSPTMKSSFTSLANEFLDLTGEKLNINSAFRSKAAQEKLWKKDPSKAAPPGSSMHEFGYAVDADSKQLDRAKQLGLLAKNKIVTPINGEPWHAETEGARMAMRKKSDSEERMQMTAQVSSKSGSDGTAPVVINNQAAPPKSMVRVDNPPIMASSLTTRNNDSSYQAIKLQEAARIA